MINGKVKAKVTCVAHFGDMIRLLRLVQTVQKTLRRL